MGEWLAEEKDRLNDALEDIANELQVIAKNTQPADTELQQVIAERDKLKMLFKGLIGFSDGIATSLELNMGEADLLKRAQLIRSNIQSIRDYISSFDVENL